MRSDVRKSSNSNSVLNEKFNGNSIKILLVDDEQNLREVLKDTLHDKFDLNFIIEEAENGQVALDLIKNSNYDIYVLDLNMPLKNGLDVLKYLRNKERDLPLSSKSKILVLSGYIDKLDDNTKKTELLMEEKYLLSKPFQMVEFLEKIEKILLTL